MSAELDALFEHVDRALNLCAEASGELGVAGSASSAYSFSPFGVVPGIKKFLGQRRARRLLAEAKPHIDAIYEARNDAKAWLASPPDVGSVGSVGWLTVDLASELAGGGGDAIIDSIVHDRIEGQLVELKAFVDELGALHLKLRQVRASAQKR